jgi:hypothetical protein
LPAILEVKSKDKYMRNIITKSIPDLLAQSAIAKVAATEHGPGIPLLQNTAANIGTDADALATARNHYEQGKVVLTAHRETLASVLLTVRLFLTLGRDLLKPLLGMRYSSAYTVLGFVGAGSIPYTAEELLPILQAYKAYFEANPAHENPLAHITAVRAEELYQQLLGASSDVALQKTEVQTLIQTRNAAASRLRKRLRSLISEVAMHLGPMDPRWIAFGFNRPGAEPTPQIVEGVSVALIDATAAAVHWNPSAYAGHYRVWTKVIGIDERPEAVGSPTDTDFMIEHPPRGVTIEIYVSAVNGAGESPLSQKVTIVTDP